MTTSCIRVFSSRRRRTQPASRRDERRIAPEVFDGIRKSVQADRAQLFKELSLPFSGYDRPGAQMSEGVREELLGFIKASSLRAFLPGILV